MLKKDNSVVMCLLFFYLIFLQVCEEGEDEPKLVAVDCGRRGQLLLSCRLSRAGYGISNTGQCTTTKSPQRALHLH